ncbi:MAG: YqgE/AlgH family protein [Chitinophagaceae bacterium]|jgi:putative transcriptional regulator
MIDPAAGVLLIADPFLKDPNFLRSVVFLCDHREDGSFGFVLNRPYTHTLEELVPEAAGFNLPVFYGGPVQQDTLHFLHQYPEKIPGSQEVINGVYWGGTFETVLALLKAGELDQNRIRFFIGYSGWGDGQLAAEINEKSWLTVEARRQLIFHGNVAELWKDALKHLGGDYEMMINYPIDPQLN